MIAATTTEATLGLARGPHLTEAQRRCLVGLIADHPVATCEAIARRFEAETGRPINPSSVRKVWVHGYRPPVPGARGYSLTESERATLARICREADAGDRPGELARRFATTTGRPITRQSVGRFLRSRLASTARGASEGVPG